MKHLEVANTIKQQLGRGFSAMTGARNFLAHDEQRGALSFRLGAGAKYNGKTVNYVKITLTPHDLYDLEFGYARGIKYTVRTTVDMVDAESLSRVFEETTGLYTTV